MQILDNLIIITLIVTAFITGMKLDNHYHRTAAEELKNALERQFVRLQAKADADDPCKPYIAPVPQVRGDFDGDLPITPQFMEHLRKNGKASTKLRAK